MSSPIPQTLPTILTIPDSIENEGTDLEETQESQQDHSITLPPTVPDIAVNERISAFYDFTVPYDVSPTLDEMEKMIEVCKKVSLKPTKINPSPTIYDKINRC